jgi:hypothetical protein
VVRNDNKRQGMDDFSVLRTCAIGFGLITTNP